MEWACGCMSEWESEYEHSQASFWADELDFDIQPDFLAVCPIARDMFDVWSWLFGTSDMYMVIFSVLCLCVSHMFMAVLVSLSLLQTHIRTCTHFLHFSQWECGVTLSVWCTICQNNLSREQEMFDFMKTDWQGACWDSRYLARYECVVHRYRMCGRTCEGSSASRLWNLKSPSAPSCSWLQALSLQLWLYWWIWIHWCHFFPQPIPISISKL